MRGPPLFPPALALAAALALPAGAAPITSTGSFTAPATYGFDDGPTVELTQYLPDDPGFIRTTQTFALGPVSVTLSAEGGAIESEGVSPLFRMVGDSAGGPYPFIGFDNGVSPVGTSWDAASGRGGYAALRSDRLAFFRFTFSEPVGRVAAFVNGSLRIGDSQSTLSFAALDAQGNELEAFRLIDLPFTPAELTDRGGVRGFDRPTLDIWAFEVRNGFAGVDDLTIDSFGLGGPVPHPPAPIPLPAGLPLLLGAVGLLALLRRRA